MILDKQVCLFFQPDLVKEFEFNADLHEKDQSVLPWSFTDKTKTTTTTTESSSTLNDTHQPLTSLHSAQNNQDSSTKKIVLKESSNDTKQLVRSSSKSDKDILQPRQPGLAIEPCKLHNVEDLQTSLKDVLRTVKVPSTNYTTGQEVESAEHEDDDELEFLLSLGTPGSDKKRGPSAGLHSNKVSCNEKI